MRQANSPHAIPSARATARRLALLAALAVPLMPASAQDGWSGADEQGATRTGTEHAARKPVSKVKQASAESRKPATAAPPAPAAASAGTLSAPILNICVINRQSIIQGADINVASSKRLSDLRQQAQEEIAKSQQALQAELKALNDEKRAPGDEVLKSRMAALEARVQALAARADVKRRQIDMTRDVVNKQISTAALPLLQAAEKERSCTLLLSQESVLDGPGATDITPIVMAAMNAQLHPMPFPLAELAPGASAPVPPQPAK